MLFRSNKNECIKRILDNVFDDAFSNLEKLPNANLDDLCQKITYGILNKGTADYFYLIQKKMSLKEYILILFGWINEIISFRNSIRNNKSTQDDDS